MNDKLVNYNLDGKHIATSHSTFLVFDNFHNEMLGKRKD